jgi:hypothetical protein
VRQLAAHEDGIGLARQVEIVRVAALAAQERRILHARHRLADAELGQGKGGVVERIHYAYSSQDRATPVALLV